MTQKRISENSENKKFDNELPNYKTLEDKLPGIDLERREEYQKLNQEDLKFNYLMFF